MKLPKIIFTAIWLILFPTIVHAGDLKVVVSPPLTEVNGKPGEVVQKTIKITNNGDSEIILSSVVSDFIVQDDQGTPIKVTSGGSGRYLASPWFTLTDHELIIAPQETITLAAVITIPKDALPGGHYSGVFFSPKTSNKPSTTGASIVPEIGSLFAINVPGDISYNAAITSFTTKQNIMEFGPVDFEAIVENQSDTHLAITPNIEIKDMLGRSLERFNLSTTNIFPFTSRSFKGTWNNVWGLGRYSATLTAPYGDSYATSRVLYFWIIPYRLIAAFGVIVLVLIFLFIVIRRHKKHNSDTRDQEIDMLKRRLVELENNKQ